MSDIIRDYLPELLAAIIAFLTAMLTYIGNVIKTKITEKMQNEEVYQIIDSVVKYVEQKATCKGEEKKQMAIDKAQEWLLSKGITVSDTELEILIEAAVNGIQKGAK